MIAISILSVIPILIWVLMLPLSTRFSDFTSITTSIGQILGLLGMVLFSINLILASRLKSLDKYFQGLDRVYFNHQKVGTIAFSMLLFHPIFLVAKYITFSLRDAALFFIPFTGNIPVTWGIISLLLMIILLSITFYLKLKYNIWKLSHKFMTVAFVFAIFHSIFISSDISRNILLKSYILILASIGLFLSVRAAFLSKYLIKKLKYVIKKVNVLNQDVVEIEMDPVGKKFEFNSGQFVFVSFKDKNIGFESHPFSITSSSTQNSFSLMVKNLGDFTSNIKHLVPGTEVLIEGPFGNFFFKKAKSKSQIWIAGGIGITPFLSMSKELNEEYNVDLYYCVKDQSEAVLYNELKEKENKNFKVYLWSSNEKGYINAQEINKQSGSLERKDIFMCGPLPLMKSLDKQFTLLGVDKSRIHYENFNFL